MTWRRWREKEREVEMVQCNDNRRHIKSDSEAGSVRTCLCHWKCVPGTGCSGIRVKLLTTISYYCQYRLHPEVTPVARMWLWTALSCFCCCQWALFGLQLLIIAFLSCTIRFCVVCNWLYLLCCAWHVCRFQGLELKSMSLFKQTTCSHICTWWDIYIYLHIYIYIYTSNERDPRDLNLATLLFTCTSGPSMHACLCESIYIDIHIHVAPKWFASLHHHFRVSAIGMFSIRSSSNDWNVHDYWSWCDTSITFILCSYLFIYYIISFV